MRGVSGGAAGFTTLILALTAADEVSAARIPVPVFFGQGEQIAHLCDLPGEVEKQICKELGVDDVAVGFFYKKFHIFWVDAWTWGGSRVLFKGNQYWTLPPEAWEAILGKEASEGLSKPFLYRFPPCIVLIGSLLLLGVAKSALLPSIATRVRRLLKDHRYQEALAIYFEKLTPPEPPPGAEPRAEQEAPPAVDPAAAFRTAREHLVCQAIPPERAEDNLRLLLQAMASEYRARQAEMQAGAGA